MSDIPTTRHFPLHPSSASSWRSLDERAGVPSPFTDDEFPDRSPSRRDALRILAGTAAIAALSACTRQPEERIVPYVQQPESIIPGRPLFYATAMPYRGRATGLLIETHEGRPTKVEGNPQHPASLGATLPFHQASVLDLYDSQRSQAVLLEGKTSTWGAFFAELQDLRERLGNGTGFHILSEPAHSPTLVAQRQELRTLFPAMQWYEFDATSTSTGAGLASRSLGRPVQTTCRFDRCQAILALDSDFLTELPGSIPYSRAFISRRRAGADRAVMNRLYAVEPTPSLSGCLADHRFPLAAHLISAFGAEVERPGGGGDALPADLRRKAALIAADLRSHPGASLVIAGEAQPATVHALAHRLNVALGNVGKTVIYTAEPDEAGVRSIGDLAAAMRGGQVQTLLVLGGDPVASAPADLDFARQYQRLPRRIHLGTHLNQTARFSHWHLPEVHYLEAWSDALAFDGTRCIVQPVIAPLYDGRGPHELLSALAGRPGERAYDTVRKFWQKERGGDDFEERWERWLHDGIIPSTMSPNAPDGITSPGEASSAPEGAAAGGMEVVFRPDPSLGDGRFATNQWLQELPKPHSKLTWDAAAYFSPRAAARLGIKNEDMVRLGLRGRHVEAPVWIVPGQADESVTVFLGPHAYALRTAAHPFFDQGLTVEPLGRTYPLASTQTHQSMEGRDVVRVGSNDSFQRNPRMFEKGGEKSGAALSLYQPWPYQGHRWGMMIDQNACIGCNSCVVACVSENNIPTVGKDQVLRGREMHWIRIDQYHSGSADRPSTLFQPVPCMHCEQAPCEPVCPVAATVHSGEGLNQMVYNRCVGTRYCSNNCPYKVRRFNFLLYTDWEKTERDPQRNPDVTVRSRGVMEKCTYCVQRIQQAKIQAEKEERPLHDGEIITACQAACPTEAIVFGDLNDQGSRVTRLAKNALSYSLLEELNTQPRTRYLARLHNRHPEMAEET